MNQWLATYLVDVRFPDVSGVEHLQLLHTRDRIAETEASLSSEERTALYEADHLLVTQASAFYGAISRFLDMRAYRTENVIDPSRWWWYLDVIRALPLQGSLPTPH